MTVPTPEWDAEFANAVWRSGSVVANMIKLVPKAVQTGLFLTPVNTDATGTFPTGYTSLGGLGTVGVVAAVKTTAGVPADTDWSGATPAIPLPPIGTMIWSTSTTKLYVRNAAGSYLASVALT